MQDISVAKELISEIPKGLLNWYDFKEFARVLQIVVERDALTELLEGKNLQVIISTWEECFEKNFGEENEGNFDYIVVVGVVEQCVDINRLFWLCKKMLKPDGILLAGMDNRLGIRYFCGDRDPFTNRNFDGIENYQRVQLVNDMIKGRCYSKAEIECALVQAGFDCRRYYSVFPNIDFPQLLYAEDYLPEEELATRILPMYHCPETVFLEEEIVYSDLVRNGMFHSMANGYLIECSLTGQLANMKHVTLSTERGREDALMTIIRRDGLVEKRALYSEGKVRLQQIADNALDLRNHGICVIEGELHGDSYIMPYVKGEIAVEYLHRLLYEDKEAFIAEMDMFRELILKSSEVIDENEKEGVVLKRGYFDLAPINCFYVDGKYCFFDQEFVAEDYPADVMIFRMINFVYHGDLIAEKVIPSQFFYERYGIVSRMENIQRLTKEFLAELKKEKELRCFHETYRRNSGIVHSNRQRINYSVAEYQRLFIDIFENTDGRKLFLFGTGKFAEKFIALYGNDYPVHALLDNNEDKWGGNLKGIPILSPDVLKDLQSNEYKVIICIKNYASVMNQLKDMGIKEFSIYDAKIDIPRKKRKDLKAYVPVPMQSETKKYKVGYIAGVFDLFHVGHLNMFKRAKEQCEYLIVGVVTDEGVRKHKQVEPFIPFEERIEMVRSCKYVDEAVEIPVNYGGTRDAYRLYHFDCQFSGSDYVDNPDWLAEKMFLEKQGADMVFFPYTEGTSSTKIKKMIEKSLL